MAGYARPQPRRSAELGDKVRDKAIKVTLGTGRPLTPKRSNAPTTMPPATRRRPEQTQSPGYIPPTQGRPDDDEQPAKTRRQRRLRRDPALFTQFAMPNPAERPAGPRRPLQGRGGLTLEPSLQIRLRRRRPDHTPADRRRARHRARQRNRQHHHHSPQTVGRRRRRRVRDLHQEPRNLRRVSTRDRPVARLRPRSATVDPCRALLTDIWEIGNKTLKVTRRTRGLVSRHNGRPKSKPCSPSAARLPRSSSSASLPPVPARPSPRPPPSKACRALRRSSAPYQR